MIVRGRWTPADRASSAYRYVPFTVPPGAVAVAVRLGHDRTWVEAEDDDVLGALAAGRTAISAERDGPVVVRHEGDLVALDADGTALNAPDGRTWPIRGAMARLPAGDGPFWLTDARGLVVALTH